VKEPAGFEGLLWRQLRLLHERDTAEWDPSVSSDPGDPRFAFSFGGRAFFVVGLAPSGERWARTFPWPLLAFNAHRQFRELRTSGKFERIQEVVRERDEALEGDLNPNLSDWGSHTEARQYSGREVEDDWTCPVQFGETNVRQRRKVSRPAKEPAPPRR
jgi:FPC/CPF motif-containing protein YcgG